MNKIQLDYMTNKNQFMKNIIGLAILALAFGCGGAKINQSVGLANGTNGSGVIAKRGKPLKCVSWLIGGGN